jgi:hypothetical protein
VSCNAFAPLVTDVHQMVVAPPVGSCKGWGGIPADRCANGKVLADESAALVTGSNPSPVVGNFAAGDG